MGAKKKKQMGVWGLIIALVVIIFGGVAFMGALGGWFGNTKVILDEEYKGGCDGYTELSVGDYDKLVAERKSFVIFVDQNGCTTADRLREFVRKWAIEKGVKVYRMMFADVRESALHKYVTYYPSVVIVSKGKPVAWLRADADEDADAYNEEGDFRAWISKYL